MLPLLSDSDPSLCYYLNLRFEANVNSGGRKKEIGKKWKEMLAGLYGQKKMFAEKNTRALAWTLQCTHRHTGQTSQMIIHTRLCAADLRYKEVELKQDSPRIFQQTAAESGARSVLVCSAHGVRGVVLWSHYPIVLTSFSTNQPMTVASLTKYGICLMSMSMITLFCTIKSCELITVHQFPLFSSENVNAGGVASLCPS